MSDTTRFWIAALVSPIAAPVFAAGADIFLSESSAIDGGQFLAIAEVSYALMLIVGLPAIYLCRKYRKFSFWVLLLVGTVIGASVGLYIERLLADISMNQDVDYFFILMYAALGTTVSVTFGIIHGTRWRVGHVGDT